VVATQVPADRLRETPVEPKADEDDQQRHGADSTGHTRQLDAAFLAASGLHAKQLAHALADVAAVASVDHHHGEHDEQAGRSHGTRIVEVDRVAVGCSAV
jgi:hypothetical protein